MATATIGGERWLIQAQRGAERDIDAGLRVVVNRIRNALLQLSGGEDRPIPLRLKNTLLIQAGEYVSRYFVGEDGRSAYRGVQPLSPYATALNKWLEWVQVKTVGSHQAFMLRVLASEPDILRWLASAPEQSQLPVQEVFRPNPLAEYEPAHTWVDPNGYRLSDRIWRVSTRTRDKIDAILTEGIREGKGSLEIAKSVERFLLPSRAPLRTKKPYGTDASFDAMRLARTEIARAQAQASLAAANTNPFVTGMDFALSASHPRVDICDKLATIGMDGERLKEPYPKEESPIPIKDTHPLCLCNLRPSVAQSIPQVIEQLRTEMRNRLIPPPNPVAFAALLRSMLGQLWSGLTGG